MNPACDYQTLQFQLDESADALEGLQVIIAILASAEATCDPATLEQISLALAFALAECARRADSVASALDSLIELEAS